MRNAFVGLLLWCVAAAGAFAGQPPVTFTPVPGLLDSGVRPSIDLQQAIDKVAIGQPVTACLVGDSTGMPFGGANGVNIEDGTWALYKQYLERQNPNVSFNFVNRAIGGGTYAGVAGTNYYSAAQEFGLTWYTNSAATWATYVVNANCDILAFNFGVNDGFSGVPSVIWTDIQQEESATVHPGLIFITNAAANPNAGGTWSQPNYQTGYIAAQSVTRSIAQIGPGGFSTAFTGAAYMPSHFGLIDVGRFSNMASFGKDYSDQAMSSVLSSVGASKTLTTTAPLSFYKTDGDFDVAGTIGNASAFTGGTTLNFNIGSMDGVSPYATLLITPSTTTTASVYFQSGGQNSFNKAVTYPAANSTLSFEVAVKGNQLYVMLGGTLVYDQPFIKPNAPFSPTITEQGTGPLDSVPITLTQMSIGTARPYNIILNQAQTWGPSIYGATTAAASSAGAGTITLNNSITGHVSVNTVMADVNNPSAIPPGTTVAAIDSTGTIVTPSVAIASPGAALGDAITFGSTAYPLGGGNGINHQNSAALNYAYAAAFRVTDFCLLCYVPQVWAQSANDNAAATGTTVANATMLTVRDNTIISGTAVNLAPGLMVGLDQIVRNRTGAAITVFPGNSSNAIESGSAGAGVTVASGADADFAHKTSALWRQ